MRTLKIYAHLTDSSLKKKLDNSVGGPDHWRWQCLYMIQVGKQSSAGFIADLLGVSRFSVYQLIQTYNKKGVADIATKSRGGRHRFLLDLESEKALIGQIESDAIKGNIKTAQDIRAIVEKKIGHKVSDDYLWDLLHRHGWKKKVPRPYHPKKDIGQQESFKKNSPKHWQPMP